MTENPYAPSQGVSKGKRRSISVHWRPVLVGFAIGLIGGCVLAAIWGMIGFIAYYSYGPSADTFYNSYVASILGWCIGIVPFLFGLIYACRAMDDSWIANCWIIATLSVGTSIPFLFFDDDPFDWSTVVHYGIEFILASVVGMVWSTREKH